MSLDREARGGGLKPITVTVKQALAISGLGLTKLYELINLNPAVSRGGFA